MSEGLLEPEEKDIRWFSNDESYPPEKREEEKEEEEEESGFSPMRMAALRAAASLLQNSGWRYQPMTTGELIGHAIPAGIKGYYEQDAYNLQQQQLEDQELATIEEDRDKQNQYRSFAKNVDQIPDNVLAVGGDTERASNRRAHLKQMFLDSPEKAMAALNKIYEKLDEVRYREPKTKTLADMRADEKAKVMEKVRASIPKRIATLMQMENVPEIEKTKIQTMYGNTDLLTHDRLAKFEEDYTTAMSSKKERDYTNEYQRKYEFLKSKDEWAKLTPQEKRLVESTQFTENKKEAVDTLQKMMDKSEYHSDWKLVDTIPKYDAEGNEKTVTKLYRNQVTGEEYKEVSRGALGTVKIQSMTGKEIKAKFPKWKHMKFDDNKLYTIETDLGDNVRLSGTIIDLSEKEPEKAKEYAANMLTSAVEMGFLDPDDAFDMQDWEPDSLIRNLNTLFLRSMEEPPDKDPNAGVIRDAETLNKEAKEKGEPERYIAGKNYYWDTTKQIYVDVGAEEAQTAFDNEEKLRGEFDKNTKKFGSSTFAYNSIVAGYNNSLKDPASAGVNDIMIVRAFLLMIEPNSVVRESEFGTAAKSQGMYEYTKNLIAKMKDGAILTQASRRRFYNAAMGYMAAVKRGYKIQMDRYRSIAKYHGIEPNNVLVDIFADRPELEVGGKYAYEPYEMKESDWMDLKNTHLELTPPGGEDGLQKKNSNNPPLKL